MKKNSVYISCLVMFLISSALAGAQTVSVWAFQDTKAGTSEALQGFLDQIVGSCMDEFFANGMIGTSDRPMAMARDDFLEKAPDRFPGWQEARDGYVSYAVAFIVKTKKSRLVKSLVLPDALEYAIFDLGTGKVLARGKLEGQGDSSDAGQNLTAWCLESGKALSSALDSCLAQGKAGGGR